MWMEISATWQVLLSPTYNGSSCCLLIILLNWTLYFQICLAGTASWQQSANVCSWAKRLFEGLGPSVCLRVLGQASVWGSWLLDTWSKCSGHQYSKFCSHWLFELIRNASIGVPNGLMHLMKLHVWSVDTVECGVFGVLVWTRSVWSEGWSEEFIFCSSCFWIKWKTWVGHQIPSRFSYLQQ